MLIDDTRLQRDPSSIDAETIQSDTQAAIDMLQDLQSQYETASILGSFFPADCFEQPSKRVLIILADKNSRRREKSP